MRKGYVNGYTFDRMEVVWKSDRVTFQVSVITSNPSDLVVGVDLLDDGVGEVILEVAEVAGVAGVADADQVAEVADADEADDAEISGCEFSSR